MTVVSRKDPGRGKRVRGSSNNMAKKRHSTFLCRRREYVLSQPGYRQEDGKTSDVERLQLRGRVKSNKRLPLTTPSTCANSLGTGRIARGDAHGRTGQETVYRNDRGYGADQKKHRLITEGAMQYRRSPQGQYDVTRMKITQSPSSVQHRYSGRN